MKKKMKIMVALLAAIILLGFVSVLLLNQWHSRYEQLDKTDRFILKEYNTYVEKAETEEIWKDFALEDKTILALKGKFGNAYLINPQNEVRSIFAKKIRMPSQDQIEVYRISAISPQLFKVRKDGNFNTDGKKYRIYGQEVYFTRYDTASVTQKYSSSHYMCFLAHEAFHYYMQGDWVKGSTYATDEMSAADRELLFQEYAVLEKIQNALLSGEEKKEAYLNYAREYVAVMKQRMAKNPSYVTKETERELVEGTATYVGIKAAAFVGYDFGVMYFDNVKDVPFSNLKLTVEAGAYDVRQLADRIPYESGALLCLLMDRLEIPDWQERLNKQTKEQALTQYDLIEDYVESL